MNPTPNAIAADIQTQRQELDRLLHRRGDIDTMKDDCAARAAALNLEGEAIKGAITATRSRLGQLEEQARQQPQLHSVPPGTQIEGSKLIPPGTQMEGPVAVAAAGKKS